MANPKRGEVRVLLDGEQRTIRFTTNAICTLESRLGMPIHRAFDGSTFGLVQVREALSVGLQAAGDKRMTSERVGDLMDLEQLASYTEAVIKAINLAFGGKDAPADPPEAVPTNAATADAG